MNRVNTAGSAPRQVGESKPANLSGFMPSGEDLLFEEELLRTPDSVQLWARYLEARKEPDCPRRRLIFERAVRTLPGSYKLWHAYLKERCEATRDLCITSRVFDSLNNTFERALVTLYKMPKVWELYLGILVKQRSITKVRHTFDRALAALPVTQHERIWKMYLVFVKRDFIPIETARQIYRRYLKFEPGHAEEYIEFLKARHLWSEAASWTAEILNDDTFQSLSGKSRHDFWVDLCEIVTRYPNDMEVINVDATLRGGIEKMDFETGRLWASLADYYIRRGLFDKACDVFEEGITSVNTVHDFSLIFDAYAHFEESTLNAKLVIAREDGDRADAKSNEDHGADFLKGDTGDDVDLRLARLEKLVGRRPELISSVMLRQNPHDISEWKKRVSIFEGDPERQILTFTEAIRSVDSLKAVGKYNMLWVEFGKFYERHDDIVNARVVFEKAVRATYRKVDDLATVWCEWAEFELRQNNFSHALTVLRRATEEPPKHAGDVVCVSRAKSLHVQQYAFKSLKLWTFRCDLEESVGSFLSARDCYDRMINLRVATPQTILNFAAFLQEKGLHEDSFQVYERGVNLFNFPHSRDIWRAYLHEIVKYFGGDRIEHTRDLFEQCCVNAPANHAKFFYIEYARLEENFGVARRAMDIYKRACQSVPDGEKLEVYRIYITRAMHFFGIDMVRSIYQKAIEEVISRDLAVDLSVQYAHLETKLGELDRARVLYVHASQFGNLAERTGFWDEWNRFEIHYGNEDTFREMLRIKRSVSANVRQMHFNVAVTDISSGGTTESGGKGEGQIPAEIMPVVRDVDGQRAADPLVESSSRIQASLVSGHNPDEIDVDITGD